MSSEKNNNEEIENQVDSNYVKYLIESQIDNQVKVKLSKYKWHLSAVAAAVVFILGWAGIEIRNLNDALQFQIKKGGRTGSISRAEC